MGRSIRSKANRKQSGKSPRKPATSAWRLALEDAKLVPICLAVGVVPLIVFLKRTPVPKEYANYWITDHVYDFFSYYKAQALGLSALLLIGIVLCLSYTDRLQVKRSILFVPLSVYAGSVLLSAFMAEHKDIAFGGFFERAEGMWVLLAYVVLLVGTYWIVETERDLRIVLCALGVSLGVISLIGMFQFFGLDFFRTSPGRSLILPAKYEPFGSALDFNFGRHIIYTTLSNPNYVGSMMAIACPCASALFILAENRRTRIMYGAILVVLVAVLLGSNSRAAWGATLLALMLLPAVVGKADRVRAWKGIAATCMLGLIEFGGLQLLSDGALGAGAMRTAQDVATLTGREASWGVGKGERDGLKSPTEETRLEQAIRQYGTVASGRAYIWLRTVPMVTQTVLVGRGPDTFALYFPNADPYKAFYGSRQELIDKPHNMYLQIWFNLGGVGLLGFVAAVWLHFRRSFTLLRATGVSSPMSRVAAALFVGWLAYVAVGLFHDSSVSVAPVFWVMFGMSMAANDLIAGRPRISPIRGAMRPGWVTAVLLAGGVGLGVLGFALYSTMRGPAAGDAELTSAARTVSSTRPRISGWDGGGLELTEVADGRPAFSLKVERVRYEPAPLGFFHIGFLQVPVLEDTRLTLQTRAGSAGGSNPVEEMESAFASLLSRQDIVALGWIGGLVGVKASPLRVQVLRHGREILALGSATANVDLRQRRLDLEGQVRLSVDGGARILESDRLHFSLKTQQIWTDREVRLQTPTGRSQASGFSGDVLLRTVDVRQVRLGETATGQDQAAEMVGEEGRP